MQDTDKKYLLISSNDGNNVKFPQFRIFQDTYMLETVESHYALLSTLTDWKSNQRKCDDDIFKESISNAQKIKKKSKMIRSSPVRISSSQDLKNRRSYGLDNDVGLFEDHDETKSLSLDQKSKRLLDFFGIPYMDARELNSNIMNSDDDEGERLNLGQRLNLEGHYSNIEFANKNTNQTVSKSQLNYLKNEKRDNMDDTEALPKNINQDFNVKKRIKKIHLPYKYVENEVKPIKIEPKIVNPDNDDAHLQIVSSEDNDVLKKSNEYNNTEGVDEDLENSETLSKGLAFHKKAAQSPGLVQSNKKLKNLIMTPTSLSRKSSIDDSDFDSSFEQVQGNKLIQEEDEPDQMYHSARRSLTRSAKLSVDDSSDDINMTKNKEDTENNIETTVSMSHKSFETKGYIFTSDINHNVKQWRSTDFSLKKVFENIHNSQITDIVCSHNCKFQFTIETAGNLKQWNVNDSTQRHDWGFIHDENLVYTLKLSPDDKYLFTGDDQGNLKQWGVEQMSLYHNWEKIHEATINTITVAPNSDYLFTTAGSTLKMLEQDTKIIIKSFENAHEGCIYASAITNNEEYFFTADSNGNLNKWTCWLKSANPNLVMDKSLAKIHPCQIRSIAVTGDSSILFTSDIKGSIKMFNIGGCSLNLLKHYPNAHDDSILSICTSKNSKIFYTSDKSGTLKIWAVEDLKIVELYSIVEVAGIWSMDITC